MADDSSSSKQISKPMHVHIHTYTHIDCTYGRCPQQLKADPNDYFCIAFLGSGDEVTCTFVPWGTRAALGILSATTETCAATAAT